MSEFHSPVLVEETNSYLITKKNGIYFDGTIGFAGHAESILNILNDDAIYVGTEVDDDAFSHSQKLFKTDSRVRLYKFNFSLIDKIVKIESLKFFDGIFADLGVSSFQLDNPGSGFTYRQDAALDLRMDKSAKVKASDIINSFPEEKLADLIFKYGEEKNSRKIARKICEHRKVNPIRNTKDLANIIAEITSPKYLAKTLSRVFQALRIYVNDELGNLKIFIEKAVDLLNVGGRIVILTYHSLEDRIVKEAFKYETLDCICPKDVPVCRCDKERRLKILTKKPVLPGEEEIKINRRARSAKLRAAERI